jgi:hypothetical protein
MAQIETLDTLQPEHQGTLGSMTARSRRRTLRRISLCIGLQGSKRTRLQRAIQALSQNEIDHVMELEVSDNTCIEWFCQKSLSLPAHVDMTPLISSATLKVRLSRTPYYATHPFGKRSYERPLV